MIEEMTNKKGNFVIEFTNFYGAGWKNSIKKIIENIIQPDKIEISDIEVSWNSSEYELLISKGKLRFKVNLNDYSSNYMFLEDNITEENKQKLRDWATVIAVEIEKLKLN